MGLKTTNYEIRELGLTVPTAYAQLAHVSVDLDGSASGIFIIQQARKDIGVKEALGKEFFRCKVDKTKPIHTQIYTAAKERVFTDWEDDIIEETETV